MKTLYWLSWLPLAPFLIIGGIAGVIAGICGHVTAWIHDATTYRIWLVLHKRKLRPRQECQHEYAASVSGFICVRCGDIQP